MTEDELEAALEAAEDDVAAEIRAILAEVAQEYADALDAATELVAARFSVSRIASMWAQRVPRLMRRLLGVAETAADAAATQVEDTLPDGWDDLPARYDDDTLPAQLGDYVTGTEHLLRAVGERLAAVATEELAAGVSAGEDLEQLRARLRARFDREGTQLGATREELIARTESSRAWNSATLAAAQAMTGPDRPLVKQWQTRRDARVRDAHDQVDGQLRLLDEPFTVAGVSMQAPGDPAAPPELVCNCRCILRLATADRAASLRSEDADPLAPFNTAIRETLAAAGVKDSERYSLRWDSTPIEVSAAAEVHTGAMVALIPTAEDAQRLALDDGEPADELHCTLAYLGEGADWTEDQRNELAGLVRARAEALGGPVKARAFGVNHWNPGDEGVWVWPVGDDRESDGPGLDDAHNLVTDALESTHERPEVPQQHTPWAAHVTGTYTGDTWPLAPMTERLGPLTFDRIRLAFAGEHIDIPLTSELEAAMDEDEMPGSVRAWTTPEGTALAYLNEETGDGRIFAADALYWDGAGPWPLQYAEEMRGGHDGAELCGAIKTMSIDVARLTGTGVLYSLTNAGWDAEWLLDQGAPLGVSVDLDNVDVQFVDRSPNAGEEPALILASFATVSVLPMQDGSYAVTATRPAEWTASGTSLTRATNTLQFITGPAGQVTLTPDVRAHLTAAAGDPDNPDDGVIVHEEHAGEWLVRITRGRVRGATLVAMPAYDKARIVLEPRPQVADEPAVAPAEDVFAAAERDAEQRTDDLEAQTAAAFAARQSARNRVVQHVRDAAAPVTAREVADALDIDVSTVRRHLADAVDAEEVVRLARGMYVGVTDLPEGSDLAAAVTTPDDVGDELMASMWSAMAELPPMPAAWFREPTAEELPEGSAGVHYAKGRIFGWVAKAGEPHAGYPGKKLTVESLGALDMTHFLRQTFTLDDGSTVKAGAFTMGVGHHRDGAECETAACQFDSTRTVAGVVTTGLNERGLWFSGAASPYLSDWDRTVFTACQPSYHMRQGTDGRWQLRAVLSVPVPGHSTPLLASVVERSNIALAASAAALALAEDEQIAVQASAEAPAVQDAAPAANVAQTEPEPVHDAPGDEPAADPARPHPADDMAEFAAAMVAAPGFFDHLAAAMERRTQAAAEVAALSERLAPVREALPNAA
ncbi:hypothetical protein SUDANB1_05662 [Streptomyces sp. enrichment culture]|uniref:phage minor head protein n=1 Tax=Streptomyces sp. enrichment culture TaxID=1795815 RepID=UPI003F56A06A